MGRKRGEGGEVEGGWREGWKICRRYWVRWKGDNKRREERRKNREEFRIWGRDKGETQWEEEESKGGWVRKCRKTVDGKRKPHHEMTNTRRWERGERIHSGWWRREKGRRRQWWDWKGRESAQMKNVRKGIKIERNLVSKRRTSRDGDREDEEKEKKIKMRKT